MAWDDILSASYPGGSFLWSRHLGTSGRPPPRSSLTAGAFGSVVSSEVIAGVVTGRLIATRETLRLAPLLRREIRLSGGEIAGIEFERQWAPPFWVKTVVHFRLIDGRYVPKVYIGRTRKVRAGLT